MSRKSLVEVRREEILQGFWRCVIKYGLDVSLEQIAAETGVQRSIIRHYIGNRDEVVEALIDRISRAYLEAIRAKLAATIDARSESVLLDYLFAVDADYADWDKTIVNVLVTSKERYPSAKKKLQAMFSETFSLLSQALRVFHPGATAEQCDRIGYALFCLVTAHETIQEVGLNSEPYFKVRESAELLLQTLK